MAYVKIKTKKPTSGRFFKLKKPLRYTDVETIKRRM